MDEDGGAEKRGDEGGVKTDKNLSRPNNARGVTVRDRGQKRKSVGAGGK